MKRLAFLSFILAVLVTPVQAQNQQSGAPPASMVTFGTHRCNSTRLRERSERDHRHLKPTEPMQPLPRLGMTVPTGIHGRSVTGKNLRDTTTTAIVSLSALYSQLSSALHNARHGRASK